MPVTVAIFLKIPEGQWSGLFAVDILNAIFQCLLCGNQYLTTTRSGFILLSPYPVFIQLIGLMELIALMICKSAGAGSSEYCVVPGKRKEGYCNENE